MQRRLTAVVWGAARGRRALVFAVLHLVIGGGLPIRVDRRFVVSPLGPSFPLTTVAPYQTTNFNEPGAAMNSLDIPSADSHDLFRTDVAQMWSNLHRRAWLLTQDQSAADDLVQAAFERALQARATFRHGT